MVGGYQLVDFKHTGVTTEGVKIEGVYNTIKNTKKEIRIVNMSSALLTPLTIGFMFGDDELFSLPFILDGMTVQIHITSDDVVSIIAQ